MIFKTKSKDITIKKIDIESEGWIIQQYLDIDEFDVKDHEEIYVVYGQGVAKYRHRIYLFEDGKIWYYDKYGQDGWRKVHEDDKYDRDPTRSGKSFYDVDEYFDFDGMLFVDPKGCFNEDKLEYYDIHRQFWTQSSWKERKAVVDYLNKALNLSKLGLYQHCKEMKQVCILWYLFLFYILLHLS